MSTDSVISISSRDAGNLVSFNTRRTVSATLLRANWTRREIHREPHVAGPALGVDASLAQHPFPERNHKARFFRDRHEMTRRNQAARGMAPSHQRFATRDTPFRQADDRLVMDFQFVAADADPQVVFDFLLAPRILGHRRRKEAIARLGRRPSRRKAPYRRISAVRWRRRCPRAPWRFRSKRRSSVSPR